MKKGDYNIILKYISSQNIILLLGKLFPQYIHRTILTIHYYVYHQYSVPTIFQVVTPISFLKKVILVSFLG